MKTSLILLLIAFAYNASAQTTSIPDAAFEQALVDLNIDSDRVINGLVLTSDVESLTQLILDPAYSNVPEIQDITGIQDFRNLENLTINYSRLSTIDVSQNTQLKILNCSSNMLTSIDVSSNQLLEELYIGNDLDLGPFNAINEIDLSNNPNINTVGIPNMWELNKINLKNGNNNPDMNIYIDFSVWGPTEPGQINNTVCIEVDNAQLANSNQLPYSAWNIDNGLAVYNFTENCILTKPEFNINNAICIYPNPATDVLHVNDKLGNAVSKVVLINLSGRIVRKYDTVSAEGISVSGLEKGTYILQTFTGSKVTTHKIIIK